jgi:2-methylcitrate dehydratase PrpD
VSADISTPPVTRRLAAFAIEELRETSNPPLELGRRIVQSFLASAVRGSSSEPVELALAMLRRFGRPDHATLLGRGERLDAPLAALLNGLAAHAGGYGDASGASVVSAALASAELGGASGRELLEAVLVGLEVNRRLSRGFFPAAAARGWHSGIIDAIGSAAAAARVLRLDETQAISALSAAATQAAGLQASVGTMTRSFDVGKAAANGVEAALLAARGFKGPETGIEGKRGLRLVISSDPQFEKIVAGLGDAWEIEAPASGELQLIDLPLRIDEIEHPRDLIRFVVPKEGSLDCPS